MTDQAPELLFLCLKCEQHYNVEKVTTHCPVCGWSARPPSERPVAQVREALEAIERGEYTDLPPLGDSRRRALTAERPEAAVAWRPDDLRVRIACKIVGHIYTDPNSEVGPATQSTRARGLRIADEIIALLAIQHEEPGRETMK